VRLPVRPFRLAPDDAAAGATADCGDGMTVAACFEQFAAEIAEASPSLAAAINDAYAQTSDACWGNPQATEALGRLKVLMGGLPGFREDACR
jgi:hypothetical protein